MMTVELFECQQCGEEFVKRRRNQVCCSTVCSKLKWTADWKAHGYRPRRKPVTEQDRAELMRKLSV